MVVTGRSLRAGGRADPGRVRRGADKAVVEGRFDLAASATMDAADRRDLDALLEETDAELDEDGTVIATRRVGSDGRSRARLGGRSVPAGALARFCSPVLAVHGQNDQLRLLRADRQREAVDAHGGEATRAALEAYQDVYHRWRDAERSLAERTGRARELAREADLLRHGLDEIDSVDPKPGEEAELDALIRRLTDSEELREVAGEAHGALPGTTGPPSPSWGCWTSCGSAWSRPAIRRSIPSPRVWSRPSRHSATPPPSSACTWRNCPRTWPSSIPRRSGATISGRSRASPARTSTTSWGGRSRRGRACRRSTPRTPPSRSCGPPSTSSPPSSPNAVVRSPAPAWPRGRTSPPG